MKDSTHVSKGRKGYLAVYTDELLVEHVAQAISVKDGKVGADLDKIVPLAAAVLVTENQQFSDPTRTANYIVSRVRRLRKNGVTLPIPQRKTKAEIDWQKHAKDLNAKFEGLITAEQLHLLRNND